MSNEIVRYSNQFNAQALRRFTALDLDLLMAIAARVRDKEIDEVTFTFEELRRLAHVKKNLTDKELAARIVEVNDRLLACRFRFQDDSRTVQFTLFSGFETDWKTRKLLVAVNPRFSFLLNDLTSQFTRFELAEFTALKSSYAKETYRRLKQFRQTGVWKVSLAEFRRLLDIPDSYRISHINSRVIKPIEDELKPLMNLKVHRKFAKVAAGRGRSQLVGFEFEFDPERVPGGKGTPRVDLSRSVREDTARRSLASVSPHLVEVRGWGEVWWTGDFDVAAARGHLDGSLPAERCMACRMDARNVAGHGSASNSLVDVPLFD
jgi:plasmid replication initiation protein